jgi:tetratricopeptide (TPR) repeat protein
MLGNEALNKIETALKLQPVNPEALLNLGLALGKLGRLEEALASYDRALAIRPDYAEALNNRGLLLRDLGRPEEALASYDKALAIRPDYAAGLYNRGIVLRDLGRPEEALASYDKVLAIRPDSAEVFYNRAIALRHLDRPAEALASYDKALAIRPDYFEALNNRGNALRDLKRPAEALESYDKALAIQPASPEALSNRGNALKDLGRPEDALVSCDRALAIRPDYAEALGNRGNALRDLGRPEEALASYDKAIAIRPGYAKAHFARSVVLLLCGEYAEGWRDYEWRWKGGTAEKIKPRSFAKPQWHGEDASGKTLLLHAEQGFGDTLQFCRYATLVGAKARVVLDVPRPLVRLCSSLAGVAHIIATGDLSPPFDLHCPLLSLPHAFGTTVETVPSNIPYLIPEASLVSGWRQRTGSSGFKIGICWQGNPQNSDIGRSIPLRCYRPIAAIPGVRLISIQKLHGLEQLSTLPSGMTVETLGTELDGGPDAFVDTAAVIASLDLIITCDTSIAHLAGALGRPVWVALKQVPDWRWMLHREDSPWYPTARLFRQHQGGEWDEVFERMAAELAL